MYFPDLTPYEYGREEPRPDVLNVGWLSRDQFFPRGTVPDTFVGQLEQLVGRPVNLYRGTHLCEFCPEPLVKVNERGLKMIGPSPGTFGNGEIRVEGDDGIIYVAPVLVLHYITEHGYLPPRAFLEAVARTVAPNKTMEPTR
jgi:hypothetical protein